MPDLELIVEGNKRIVRATFRVPAEPDGTLTDPTAVTFTARRRGDDPDAYVLADPEVANPSTGVYEFEFEPAEGTWHVHVQGTGAAHAAGEVAFQVGRAEALAQP